MQLSPSERLPKPEEILDPLHRLEDFCTLDAKIVTNEELAARLQGVSKAVSAIALTYGGVESSSAACLFQDILPELSQEWPGLKQTETVMRCYLTQGSFAGKLLVVHAVSGGDGAELAIHSRGSNYGRMGRLHEITHDVIVPDDKTLDALLMHEPYVWREGDYYARDFRDNVPKFGFPFKYDPLSKYNDTKVYINVLQSLGGELLNAVNQQHPMTFIKLDDEA